MFTLILVSCVAASQAACPDDALVVIEAQAPRQVSFGYGVVTGDGSRVVCPYHLAHEVSSEGKHRLRRWLKVISPFLGDIVLAEVVGHDPGKTTSLLKVPWHGHPAMPLADLQQLLASDTVTIVGMPTLIHPAETDSDPNALDTLYRKHRLPVDYLVLRRGIPESIVVNTQDLLGATWHSAPILSTDETHVLAMANAFNQKVKRLAGPSVHFLRKQVSSLTSVPIQPRHEKLSGCPTGHRLARHYIQGRHWLIDGRYEKARALTQDLIASESPCPYIQILYAEVMFKLDRREEAQTYYQKALALTPAAFVHIQYIEYLMHCERWPEARSNLTSLWERPALRPYLAARVFFTHRDQPDRCLAYLKEAVSADPNCMYTWKYLGAAYYRQQSYDAAIDAYARAVALYPENGNTRKLLIANLHEAGRIDEAEKQYRERFRREPNNARLLVGFAKFLSAHKANSTEEALRLTERALKLPEQEDLLHVEIRRVMDKIRTGPITCNQVRSAASMESFQDQ